MREAYTAHLEVSSTDIEGFLIENPVLMHCSPLYMFVMVNLFRCTFLPCNKNIYSRSHHMIELYFL